MEIFHQSRNSGLTLVHAHKQTWDLLQTGNFRRPQPPLSGNELITGPNPAHGQRLQMPCWRMLAASSWRPVCSKTFLGWAGLGRMDRTGETPPGRSPYRFSIFRIAIASPSLVTEILTSPFYRVPWQNPAKGWRVSREILRRVLRSRAGDVGGGSPMSQISEARQDSLLSWRGSAWLCRGKPRVLPTGAAVSSAIFSCTHK